MTEYKIFHFNDTRANIVNTKNTKEHILDIVASMLKLTLNDESKIDDIVSKVSICMNEILVNIFKYEKYTKFDVCTFLDNSILKIKVKIVGINNDGTIFDYEKVFLNIEKIKKTGEILISGMGLFYCDKVSDSFEIIKIKDKVFNFEYLLQFKI